MQQFVSAMWIFFVLTILGTTFVHGDPEPMARPTRPKVFTSPEELRRYLDLVKDYYSLSGKARYGKRSDASYSMSDLDHQWDALRLILSARRQMLQRKQDKNGLEKEEILKDLRDNEEGSHAVRPDFISRYYDETSQYEPHLSALYKA